MRLRRLESSDSDSIAALFYESVHGLCMGEYTPAELSAWATDDVDPEAWAERFMDQYSLVAVDGGAVVGFGSADVPACCIDMLYVSPSAAGHGVGKLLLSALESRLCGTAHVYASDTAKGFFLHMGYRVVSDNTVIRHGIALHNQLMEKELCNSFS